MKHVLLLSFLLTSATRAESTVFKLSGKIPEGRFASYGPGSGADGTFFPAALSTSPADGLIVAFTAYRSDDEHGQIFCTAFGIFPLSSVQITGSTMRFSFSATAFCTYASGGFVEVPGFTWSGVLSQSTAGVPLSISESSGSSSSTTYPTGCPGVPGVCTTTVRGTGKLVQQSANFVGSVGPVSVEPVAGTNNGFWSVRSGSASVTYSRNF